MLLELNGREVEVDSIDGVYNEEINIVEAYFLDTEEELSDGEIDQLIEENYEDLNFELMEKAIARAESYYEGER